MTNLIVNATQASATFLSSDLGRLAFDLAFQSLGTKTQSRDYGKLEDLQVLRSVQGGSIPRLFGRMRLGGQLIWMGDVQEKVTESSSGGGKGGGGGAKTSRRDYNYHLSFAIALCEGPITRIGQVWIDGEKVDLEGMSYRLHLGKENQDADPTITAFENADTPAYRRLAYIVFDDFDLTPYGNRIPQFNFEVFGEADDTADLINAVNIIPGATEFGYDTDIVVREIARGQAGHENAHLSEIVSDWTVALDDLEASCPDCKWVSLVVTWFGTDLRAADCRLVPKVDNHEKNTHPHQWRVAGLSRSQAQIVSQHNNRPAFGGTPSDESVKRAIQDLKHRGFKVMFYPFAMMDIPPNNSLPDPYGGAKQAAYPWRGHINCYPAAGEANSPDGTSAAANQVKKFFYGDGSAISPRWGLAHMIQHYANLCADAGGVDAFLLGTEFVSLSRLRDGSNSYPFANLMVTLAAEIRRILPHTKLSYAADWSEYGAHYVHATGDVGFPLDALWADSNIDFVGVDNYLPLSDWRDGNTHLDASSYQDIRQIDYLHSNIEGGEYYDWYYANQVDRKNQTRSSITDGQGKPWLFRAKDFKNWWQNQHIQRASNVETTPTAWVPKSKPIWFTEIGCPAVDKGTNQPNMFPDIKSSDAGLPYFSNGGRDDDIQRSYLKAIMSYWSDAKHNPASDVFDGRMIADDKIFVWCWDARPYPLFPNALQIWSDGDSWSHGHWLNGRMTSARLDELVKTISHDSVRVGASAGQMLRLEGVVVDTASPPREMIELVMLAFALEAMHETGRIVLNARSRLLAAQVPKGDLVPIDGDSEIQLIRAPETELPGSLKLSFIGADGNYEPVTVEAQRPTNLMGQSRVLHISLPMVLRQSQAEFIAERLLAESWIERDRLKVNLSYAMSHLEVGDLITLKDFPGHFYRITRVLDASHREIEAVRHAPEIYDAIEQPISLLGSPDLSITAHPRPTPEVIVADLPGLPQLDSKTHGVPAIVAYAYPWRDGVTVSLQNNGRSMRLERHAKIGQTLSALPEANIGRWDMASKLKVEIFGGHLQSKSSEAVLAGANMMAVETINGWEILQFKNAKLIASSTYELSGFLRGQFGSEAVMSKSLPSGARLFMIDEGLHILPLTSEHLNAALTLHYGPTGQTSRDYGWKEEQFIPDRVGLKPLAPAHLRANEDGQGGYKLRWIRRSRIGGDDFEAPEISLGEAIENYRINLIGESKSQEAWETTSPVFHITSEKLIPYASFNALHVQVSQIGSSGQRGYVSQVKLR